MAGRPKAQDPKLLRRLLRAKDRMDAASHEEWPVERLASVSGVSEAHFARSFKDAFGVPAAFNPIGTLTVGYKAPDKRSPSLKRGHRPVAEVVHHGRWAGLG